MEARISLVTLGVRSVSRSVAFYRDVLGWKTQYVVGDPVAFFQLNAMALGIYGRKALANDANVSARGHGFRGVTLAHNVRSRQEVDKVFAMIKRRGGRIVKPPKVAEWGGYSGYFSDPDGHLWEVAHNPGWKLDNRGSVVLS
jgi:uncharacterized protein